MIVTMQQPQESPFTPQDMAAASEQEHGATLAFLQQRAIHLNLEIRLREGEAADLRVKNEELTKRVAALEEHLENLVAPSGDTPDATDADA